MPKQAQPTQRHRTHLQLRLFYVHFDGFDGLEDVKCRVGATLYFTYDSVGEQPFTLRWACVAWLSVGRKL